MQSFLYIDQQAANDLDLIKICKAQQITIAIALMDLDKTFNRMPVQLPCVE